MMGQALVGVSAAQLREGARWVDGTKSSGSSSGISSFTGDPGVGEYAKWMDGAGKVETGLHGDGHSGEGTGKPKDFAKEIARLDAEHTDLQKTHDQLKRQLVTIEKEKKEKVRAGQVERVFV